MKTLKNFLYESFSGTDETTILYQPKTHNELINCVKEVIKTHKNDKIIDLNCIDTSQITDMSDLFYNAINNSRINYDVSKWDVSNVETMCNTFAGSKGFNCDLSNWNVSKVVNMDGMFENCINFNCDLSKWDVRNVERMNEMFWHCKNFKCDLSNWDVYCGDETAGMFQYCWLEKHPELQPNIIMDE